jgi:hypothetical protein
VSRVDHLIVEIRSHNVIAEIRSHNVIADILVFVFAFMDFVIL